VRNGARNLWGMRIVIDIERNSFLIVSLDARHIKLRLLNFDVLWRNLNRLWKSKLDWLAVFAWTFFFFLRFLWHIWNSAHTRIWRLRLVSDSQRLVAWLRQAVPGQSRWISIFIQISRPAVLQDNWRYIIEVSSSCRCLLLTSIESLSRPFETISPQIGIQPVLLSRLGFLVINVSWDLVDIDWVCFSQQLFYWAVVVDSHRWIIFFKWVCSILISLRVRVVNIVGNRLRLSHWLEIAHLLTALWS